MGWYKTTTFFRSFWTSSLADQPPYTRLLFLYLLDEADAGGIVTSTPQALARGANLPLADVEKSLEVLQQPDPSSTTPDEEGRRIVAVDGVGNTWRLTNYARYRELLEVERERAYQRQYKRKRREGERRDKLGKSQKSGNPRTEPELPEGKPPVEYSPAVYRWAGTLHGVIAVNQAEYKLPGPFRDKVNDKDREVVDKLFRLDKKTEGQFELALRALEDEWANDGSFHPAAMCFQVSTLREKTKRKLTKFEECVYWGEQMERRPVGDGQFTEAETKEREEAAAIDRAERDAEARAEYEARMRAQGLEPEEAERNV